MLPLPQLLPWLLVNTGRGMAVVAVDAHVAHSLVVGQNQRLTLQLLPLPQLLP